MIEQQKTVLRDVLSGHFPLKEYARDPESLGEVEQYILTMHEEMKLQDHFEMLLQKGELLVEPVSVKDIPDILEFYRERKIMPRSLVQIAAGEESPQTFLQDPEKIQEGPHMSEGPKMRKLLHRTEAMLQRTKAMRGKKRLKLRREKETMQGITIRTKLGKLVAVSLYTESPFDPDLDKDYKNENTELIEQGISGGAMTYFQPVYKDGFAKFLLGKGTDQGVMSGKLALVMTREQGLGQFAQGKGVQQLNDMDSGAQMFTYTMEDLAIFCDGIMLERPSSSAQNRRMIASLVNAGWDLKGSDANIDGPGENFDVALDNQPSLFTAKATWLHYQIALQKILAWSEKVTPRRRKKA